MRWIALMLLLAAPAQAETRRFGLFVGSNGAPPGREALRHAEADALRLRRVFVDVGQMAESDTQVLQSPTGAQIIAGLRDLARRAATDPEALVVFYYSGHADERALLLGGGQLRLDELRAELDAVPGGLALHIIDACRSGTLARSKGASRGRRIAVAVQPQAKGRAVITSSAAFEDSQESDRLGGSFFTLHLASGLRGAADADGDHRVTLAEAYAYVYARTVQSTRATVAGPQHPTYRYDLQGRGETVLAWTRPDAGAAWLKLNSGGDYLVIDAETGQVVAEVVPTGRDQVLAMRPATYRINRRDDDALFEGRVTLAPGETVAADDQLQRRIEYARLVRKGGRSVATTLWLEGGARGPLDAGIQAAPLARVAVSIHLPWFTLRPRIGFARNLADDAQQTPRLTLDLRELSAGVELRRAVDLSGVTLSGGLVGEGLWLTQTERAGRDVQRTSGAMSVGLVAGLETAPFGPVSMMLTGELGVVGYRAATDDRGPTGDELRTVATWRTTLGVGHAF